MFDLDDNLVDAIGMSQRQRQIQLQEQALQKQAKSESGPQCPWALTRRPVS